MFRLVRSFFLGKLNVILRCTTCTYAETFIIYYTTERNEDSKNSKIMIVIVSQRDERAIEHTEWLSLIFFGGCAMLNVCVFILEFWIFLFGDSCLVFIFCIPFLFSSHRIRFSIRHSENKCSVNVSTDYRSLWRWLLQITLLPICCIKFTSMNVTRGFVREN